MKGEQVRVNETIVAYFKVFTWTDREKHVRTAGTSQKQI